jgi:hypothetical protein
VHVLERVANSGGDRKRPRGSQSSFFIEQTPQQPAFHPLERHIHAAALFIRENFNDAGMVQPASDLRFAVETVEQHGVALGIRMRHFESDPSTGPGIGGAENGRHTAPADEFFDQEVVQPVAGMNGRHDTKGSGEAIRKP